MSSRGSTFVEAPARLHFGVLDLSGRLGRCFGGLGLAVARVLAEMHGLTADVVALARLTGRGLRSAIGTWTFGLGGFILEGGRRPGAEAIAPLIAHLPIPSDWRCVVAVPSSR